MSNETQLKTIVNGIEYNLTVPSRLLASDFLRDNLNLTGTHVGCEHGICGSCTIKIDGLTARSCLKFAVQLDGKKVETVENFQKNKETKNILKKFKENHSLQCGFCTPGFLMIIDEMLTKRIKYSENEIREALSGNLCRCTGYENIVKAAKIILGSKRLKWSFSF